MTNSGSDLGLQQQLQSQAAQLQLQADQIKTLTQELNTQKRANQTFLNTTNLVRGVSVGVGAITLGLSNALDTFGNFLGVKGSETVQAVDRAIFSIPTINLTAAEPLLKTSLSLKSAAMVGVVTLGVAGAALGARSLHKSYQRYQRAISPNLSDLILKTLQEQKMDVTIEQTPEAMEIVHSKEETTIKVEQAPEAMEIAHAAIKVEQKSAPRTRRVAKKGGVCPRARPAAKRGRTAKKINSCEETQTVRKSSRLAKKGLTAC